MKIFRTITAFFQALLPLLGFGIISVILYSELSSPYHIIIALSVLVFGLYTSRSAFNMMRRKGIMFGNNATDNSNELEPDLGSDVLKLTPEALTNLCLQKKIKFNRGTTVSIWGDWEGRELNVKHELNSIYFDSEYNILTIKFYDNCILKIKRPSLIFYSSSYLKIIKAKEILWQTPIDSNSNNQYSYLNTGKEIKTKSNTKWKPHTYDIGIGMNALYLQG